jgi:hypothetical protein
MHTEYWWEESWNTEEISITGLTKTFCVNVRWPEIAQACLKVDFSISYFKPSGYAAIVLITFSLTTLTWRSKTLSQRTKSNTNLHFIMTPDKNRSHTKIILVWREEYLLQSTSAVITSNRRTTVVWHFQLKFKK